MSSEQDLALFVRDHLRSVWALELLLLLRRDPERCWTVDELVRELRASTPLVRTNLDLFERGGLSVQDDSGRHRFGPTGGPLAELSARIESAYRERPVAIINLIAKPAGDPVQSLADAFKFRGGSK